MIRRERRAYHWPAAAIAACCTATAVILRDTGRDGCRIILLQEAAADVSCFWLARSKIAAVKRAEGWFTGLRQTVVAGTSWRTEPQPFPPDG